MKNVKQVAIALVVLLTGSVTLNAQSGGGEDEERRVRIGIKGGVNFSNVYDESGDDFIADGKFGWVGGAFLSIPIGEYLGLQPEVLYSQKGFDASGSVLGYSYTLTRTSNFLDIPIFLALRPAPFMTVLVGPHFSYLMSQNDVFSTPLGGYEVEQEFDNDDIRKNILGFGGGIDLNFDHVVVGARTGFDFQNNQPDGSSSTPRYKNVWLQATIGLRI